MTKTIHIYLLFFLLIGAGMTAKSMKGMDPTISSQSKLVVPAGNGTPVLIDGTFSPGEWEDAAALKVSEEITLYVKQYRGHVFIGVHCPEFKVKVCDLFINAGGSDIWKFHVSAQLVEMLLLKDGSPADRRPGKTKLWYANEVRWDEKALNEIVKAGKKTRDQAFPEVVYPYDGFEFQIKLEKFNKNRWLIRVAVLYTVDGKEYFFPRDTKKNNTAGWLELIFTD